MTRFRYPSGWNTNRQSGCRPILTGTWLDPCNAPARHAPQSVKRSYQYWSQIHWATPPWTTAEMWEEVREIYETSVPGVHEVDHVVPLRHPLVCGLNVPWNLRRASKRGNQAKSNHYWPDCPPQLCPEKNLPSDMFGASEEPHQLRLPF